MADLDGKEAFTTLLEALMEAERRGSDRAKIAVEHATEWREKYYAINDALVKLLWQARNSRYKTTAMVKAIEEAAKAIEEAAKVAYEIRF
jgi:hypothetical protein